MEVIYMKPLTILTQKTIALILATFIFSLPLSSIAAAKAKNDAPPPPPRQEERHDRRPERKDPPKPPKEEPRHNRDDRRHDAPPPPPRDHDEHDKDDNGNAVTGFIIGAAVGAIVAKNT